MLSRDWKMPRMEEMRFWNDSRMPVIFLDSLFPFFLGGKGFGGGEVELELELELVVKWGSGEVVKW